MFWGRALACKVDLVLIIPVVDSTKVTFGHCDVIDCLFMFFPFRFVWFGLSIFVNDSRYRFETSRTVHFLVRLFLQLQFLIDDVIHSDWLMSGRVRLVDSFEIAQRWKHQMSITIVSQFKSNPRTQLRNFMIPNLIGCLILLLIWNSIWARLARRGSNSRALGRKHARNRCMLVYAVKIR